jgi:hypothetical protein
MSDTHSDPTFGNTDPPRGKHKPSTAPLIDKRPASPMQFSGPDLPPAAGTTKSFVPNYYGDDEFIGTKPAEPLTPVQLNRELVPGLKTRGKR